jgi:hypothetical protein
MADDLTRQRERAAEHQRREEADRQWLTTADLARRWGVSATTVRDIPAVALPYLELGNGLKFKRRRYAPVDVEAYERRRYPDNDVRQRVAG